MYNALLCIIRVSEIFQKPPGGQWTAARRLIQFLLVFWVPERNRLAVSVVPPGDAWQTNPDSGFLLELPGGDENPLGNADQFWFSFGVLSVLIGF